MENNIETKYNKLITVVSIIIPVAVAALFGVNLRKLGYDVEPLNFLPPIYATINGVTAVLLSAAVIAIKNGKRKLHENLMKTAIACSVAFLLMYVAYHMTSISAVYGDTNHNSILEESEKLAEKLHSLGIFHRDINPNNILVSFFRDNPVRSIIINSEFFKLELFSPEQAIEELRKNKPVLFKYSKLEKDEEFESIISSLSSSKSLFSLLLNKNFLHSF